MQARDIMTSAVVTATPETLVSDIAALLIEHRISGVPVITDDRQVLGIVSESDLLHRSEIGTERKRKWWLRVLIDTDTLAREYTKSHGLTAEDIMSRHVVSIGEDASLSQVADILDAHHIKRVPVLRQGKLVGLVTRGDLVRALAQVQIGEPARRGNDGALQKALIEKIDDQVWLRGTYITAIVTDGVVELWGFIGSEDQRKALHVLVREVGGVCKIQDHLAVGYRRFGLEGVPA